MKKAIIGLIGITSLLTFAAPNPNDCDVAVDFLVRNAKVLATAEIELKALEEKKERKKEDIVLQTKRTQKSFAKLLIESKELVKAKCSLQEFGQL